MKRNHLFLIILLAISLCACSKEKGQISQGSSERKPLSEVTISPEREALFEATKQAWLFEQNPQTIINPENNAFPTEAVPFSVHPVTPTQSNFNAPIAVGTQIPSDPYNSNSYTDIFNSQGFSTQPYSTVPQNYQLRYGEWPLCIARRFNVDWDTFYAANSGILSTDILAEGTTLVIPSGTIWNEADGARRTASHPTVFQVGFGDTLAGIACYFGDITPEEIAAANYLSIDSPVYGGQTLQIP